MFEKITYKSKYSSGKIIFALKAINVIQYIYNNEKIFM